MFKLDPQLYLDGIVLGSFELSLLLLMNDKNYPWFVLVPQRADITEMYQLTTSDQVLLMHESNKLAACLAQHFNADKMNIAALGNVVSQLHIHHIVRFRHDACWPKPVWGVLPSLAYAAPELASLQADLGTKLVDIGLELNVSIGEK